MTITYTEDKGYGLILAIHAAGHTLDNHDGQWVSSDDEAVQSIIDSYDPMPHERAALLAVVNARCDEMLASVTSTYPQGEVTSWAKQEADARSFVATGKTSPLLENLSTQRGDDVADLCQKIIDKADAYAAVVGTLLGQRQVLEAAINEAETLADLKSIKSQ